MTCETCGGVGKLSQTYGHPAFRGHRIIDCPACSGKETTVREEPVRVATAEEEAASFQKAWADSLSENARLRSELARVEKERDDALRINSKYATRLCAVNKTIASVNQLAENLAEVEARAQSAEAALEEMRGKLPGIRDALYGGNALKGNDELMAWLADRLVNVYGESPNVDFVAALRERSRWIKSGLSALRSLIEKGGSNGE